jgi:hypothetical protein
MLSRPLTRNVKRLIICTKLLSILWLCLERQTQQGYFDD